MCSMQSYCDLTPKTKFMEETSHAHYLNYWKEKKFTKLNLSSNIDDEVEDTNITSNGKVIPSQKQRGKTNQHFLMTETCYNNTKYDIKSDVVDNLSNMFLRKTKSAPILKTSSTLLDKSEQLNRNIDRLQTMIDDMIKEYEYMDQPLEYPRKPESSSQTPTTDNSIFINQRND